LQIVVLETYIDLVFAKAIVLKLTSLTTTNGDSGKVASIGAADVTLVKI
jgi:hypothetical protein